VNVRVVLCFGIIYDGKDGEERGKREGM